MRRDSGGSYFRGVSSRNFAFFAFFRTDLIPLTLTPSRYRSPTGRSSDRSCLQVEAVAAVARLREHELVARH